MHLGFSSMNTADDPAPDLLAKTLEEAGFESLWYGEHSHIPASRKTPYPAGGELPAPYRKMMDPYVSLMAAAAATTRLKLGTGIALLMERELFSQAKTIATLDRLSGGRVLIGGVVTHRQRPATASGTTFIGMEDETGLMNIVVSVGCWSRYRKIARSAPALLVRGRVQKQGSVVNIVADKFEPLPVHPTSTSGVSSTMSIWSRASSPMIVWCSRTWLSTLPSAYRVEGSSTAWLTASLMAIPRLPG